MQRPAIGLSLKEAACEVGAEVDRKLVRTFDATQVVHERF